MSEPVRLPVPGRVSQATHIEQSRAAAEVFAAMQAAQALPRDENRAAERMRETCARMAFAERAFYSVPRGTGKADGPSVHMMRELARLFGNIHYGLAELDRDPVGPGRDRGRSEMVAFAWDLEANVRNSSTFIVEHARDLSAKKDWQTKEVTAPASVDPLVTLQSVYENNSNMGARRVRQAIRAVLPVWFVDEAIGLCQAALVKGDGKPLTARITDALAGFAGIGVRAERVEARVGKPAGRWTAHDLADLTILWRSIERNETTADEAFPVRPVTPAELAPPASIPAQTPDPGQREPDPITGPASDSPAGDFSEVSRLLEQLGVDRRDWPALVSLYVGRPIASMDQQTQPERETVVAALQTMLDSTPEDRAADLARDLAEARTVAAERDPQ